MLSPRAYSTAWFVRGPATRPNQPDGGSVRGTMPRLTTRSERSESAFQTRNSKLAGKESCEDAGTRTDPATCRPSLERVAASRFGPGGQQGPGRNLRRGTPPPTHADP